MSGAVTGWVLVLQLFTGAVSVPGYESQQACQAAGKHAIIATEAAPETLGFQKKVAWGFVCIPGPKSALASR